MTRRMRESASRLLFLACAGVVILTMAVILLFVGAQAWQTFFKDHVSPAAFFLGTTWSPADGEVGALQMIIGSILVTAVAVLISTPVSVGLAVFNTEIAPRWARKMMQPVLELFTGIPSIVYGLIALQMLVPFLASVYNYQVGAFAWPGFGLPAAALVLAIMILPTITTITVDAVYALPVGLREASLALGATRWQTIRQTLLPAAAPGIFTGIVLGMGRAIGETLAVSFVIGSNPNNFPFRFVDSYPFIAFNASSTITVQLLFDFKEAVPGTLLYDAIWTLAFILLVISLLLVMVSRWIGSRGAFSAPSSKPSYSRIRGSISRLLHRAAARASTQATIQKGAE